MTERFYRLIDARLFQWGVPLTVAALIWWRSDSLMSAADNIAIAATVPLAGFLLSYMLRSEWRSTDPGRALLYYAAGTFGTYAVIAATLILGRDYAGRSLVRAGFYGLVLCAAWKILCVLLAKQRLPPDDPSRDFGEPMRRKVREPTSNVSPIVEED